MQTISDIPALRRAIADLRQAGIPLIFAGGAQLGQFISAA